MEKTVENMRKVEPKSNLIWREVDGEVVIMTNDYQQMIALNEVGSHIWKLMDGKRSQAEIVECIDSEYDQEIDEIAADVETFMNYLRGAELLEG